MIFRKQRVWRFGFSLSEEANPSGRVCRWEPALPGTLKICPEALPCHCGAGDPGVHMITQLALCRNFPIWLQRRVSQFTNLKTDGSERCCYGLGFAVYFLAGLTPGATLLSLLGLPGRDTLPRRQRCCQGAASFAGPIVFLSDTQRRATGGTSLWCSQSSIRYRSSRPEMACAL